jgi:hypothetical protein
VCAYVQGGVVGVKRWVRQVARDRARCMPTQMHAACGCLAITQGQARQIPSSHSSDQATYSPVRAAPCRHTCTC